MSSIRVCPLMRRPFATRCSRRSEIDTALPEADSRTIQWDYKNIVKRKGELVRLS